MKKIFGKCASVFLAAATLASLTACGGSAGSGGTAANSKAPQKLVFSTFNNWWTNGNIQKACEMYTKATGVKIEPQIFPDDQFANIIKTKLATDQAPDIFAFYPQITWFGGAGKLEPMTGDWTKKLDMAKAKKVGYADSNGTVYTAPYGACGFQGLIYNKKLLQQNNITLPLKTYNDFLSACAKLKTAGVVPLTLPFKDSWTAQILFYSGGGYINKTVSNYATNIATNKVKPQDVPQLVDLFNRVLALGQKGYTNTDPLSTTAAMAEKDIVEGKTAFALAGDWLYKDISTGYSKDQATNIGMTGTNWSDDASMFSVVQTESSCGLFVPKTTSNVKAAMDFVNYVMSDDVMKAMYKVAPGVNDLGIDTEMSSWDDEMNNLLKGGAPVADIFCTAPRYAVPAFDSGDLTDACIAAWSSKNAVSGLQQWYNDYSKTNKAKGLAGF